MVMRNRSSSSIPASAANFSAAASISLTLSMVEGSEKLNFPAFGLVTGFVSASTGNGKAHALPREEVSSLGFVEKDAIDGSFIAGAACVKNCFDTAGSLVAVGV